MKRIYLAIIVFACLITILKAEYKSEEIYILPWGWDTDQELPYALEDDGAAFGPYKRGVDISGNIYLALPYSDFRKYNNNGALVYRKEIKIAQLAVDDSEYVYFTNLNPNQMSIIRILDKNGIELEKRYQFKINNQDQNISWMKNRNGEVSIDRQKMNPVNSKSLYFQSETAMRKSHRRSKTSFNQEFINMIIDKIVGNDIIRLDTIPLHICRYPQQAAEIIDIDKNDNFYVWIYYNLELPIDFVILDSTYKEIDRIELVPIAQSMGLWLRPYVLPDGTIYEFRDLEDGLHVIRWSRKE